MNTNKPSHSADFMERSRALMGERLDDVRAGTVISQMMAAEVQPEQSASRPSLACAPRVYKDSYRSLSYAERKHLMIQDRVDRETAAGGFLVMNPRHMCGNKYDGHELFNARA